MEKSVSSLVRPSELLPRITWMPSPAEHGPFLLAVARTRHPELLAKVEEPLQALRLMVVQQQTTDDDTALRNYAIALEALQALGSDWHTTLPVLQHGPAPPYCTLLGEYAVCMFALAAMIIHTTGETGYAALVLRRMLVQMNMATSGDVRLMERRMREAHVVGRVSFYELLIQWLEQRTTDLSTLDHLLDKVQGGEALMIKRTIGLVRKHEAGSRARRILAHVQSMADTAETLRTRADLLWLAKLEFDVAGDTDERVDTEQAYRHVVGHALRDHGLQLLTQHEPTASGLGQTYRGVLANLDPLPPAPPSSIPVTFAAWQEQVQAWRTKWHPLLSQKQTPAIPANDSESHRRPIESLARLALRGTGDPETIEGMAKDWGWTKLDLVAWDAALLAATPSPTPGLVSVFARVRQALTPSAVVVAEGPIRYTWRAWVDENPTWPKFATAMQTTMDDYAWQAWPDPMVSPREIMQYLIRYTPEEWKAVGVTYSILSSWKVIRSRGGWTRAWDEVFVSGR